MDLLFIFINPSVFHPQDRYNFFFVLCLSVVIWNYTYVFDSSKLIMVISHSTFNQLRSIMFVYFCSPESIEVIAGLCLSSLNGHDSIT